MIRSSSRKSVSRVGVAAGSIAGAAAKVKALAGACDGNGIAHNGGFV
jgi:hypothetical protein